MRRTALLTVPLTLALLASGCASSDTRSVADPEGSGGSTVSVAADATTIAPAARRRGQGAPVARADRWRPGATTRGPRPPRTGGPGGGGAAGGPDVGVQFHGLWSSYSDADRAQVLDRLVEMGSTWVRLDVSWAMIQPTAGRIDPNSWGVQNVDKVISMAHNRGLKVLGTLWLTPGWANRGAGERSAPTNPADYGRAFAWATDHWRGKVQAWEAWNEPNSGDFLVNPNPATYTRMLCSAYRAVQAAPGAPGAKVVYGGTMHNDVDWIDRTYQAGAKGCFDVMATHPYQSPTDTGPLAGRGVEPWEFAALGEVRKVMRRHGDFRAVWITEFGWSSHANNGSEPNWAKGVTMQEQARFTIAALNALRTRFPYVRKAFIYNDRAYEGSGAHLAGYGIMTAKNRPKPVWHALRSYLR